MKTRPAESSSIKVRFTHANVCLSDGSSMEHGGILSVHGAKSSMLCLVNVSFSVGQSRCGVLQSVLGYGSRSRGLSDSGGL